MMEYLHSTFEPDGEYVNGEIEERNVGEYDHNAVQKAILISFHQNDKEWRTRSIQGQRTKMRSGNVRLPDVSVFPRDLPIE
jgi:Putative restriction endonuclease